MIRIRSPRDFSAGAIYAAFGVAGLWFGWDYPMGSAGRMGGGYFPKVLSGMLILFGLLALARGVRFDGPRVAPFNLRPLLLIPAGCSLFGLLLEPVGLLGSLFLLIVLSAMASREFRLSPIALAGAAGVVGACALIFVKGLSVPMPLVGSWFSSG